MYSFGFTVIALFGYNADKILGCCLRPTGTLQVVSDEEYSERLNQVFSGVDIGRGLAYDGKKLAQEVIRFLESRFPVSAL